VRSQDGRKREWTSWRNADGSTGERTGSADVGPEEPVQPGLGGHVSVDRSVPCIGWCPVPAAPAWRALSEACPSPFGASPANLPENLPDALVNWGRHAVGAMVRSAHRRDRWRLSGAEGSKGRPGGCGKSPVRLLDEVIRPLAAVPHQTPEVVFATEAPRMGSSMVHRVGREGLAKRVLEVIGRCGTMARRLIRLRGAPRPPTIAEWVVVSGLASVTLLPDDTASTARDGSSIVDGYAPPRARCRSAVQGCGGSDGGCR
jgi:hypothetical protein